MEARAQMKFVRIAPRKVKIVCDLIRGKDARTAAAILQHTPKAASEVMAKLLKSAVSNAENNHEMDPETLYVAETYADPGPIIKRYQPRTIGQASRISGVSPSDISVLLVYFGR